VSAAGHSPGGGSLRSGGVARRWRGPARWCSAVLCALLATAPAAAAQLRRSIDLDRDWLAVQVAADAGLPDSAANWVRTPWPFAGAAAEGRRWWLRRELAADPRREGCWAILVSDSATPPTRVFVDGEAVAASRGAPRVFDLGDRLGRDAVQRLELELPAGAASDCGPLRLEWRGPRSLGALAAEGFGPLVHWTWIDPATAELVVRVPLENRTDVPVGADLELTLSNAAGLRLSVLNLLDQRLPAQSTWPATARLRAPGLLGWSAREPTLATLTLRLAVDGVPVDELFLQVAPRARGSREPAAVLRCAASWPAGGGALPDGALARDLRRLREAGLELVVVPTPREGLLAAADALGLSVASEARSLAREQAHVSLRTFEPWPSPTTPEWPAVGRADGELVLAAHARQVARAYALGRLAPGGDLAGAPAMDEGQRDGLLFDGLRRPKFAYHALRAAAGIPTCYPATLWAPEEGVRDLEVYCSGDEVELRLDGVSQGRTEVYRPAPGAELDPDRVPFAARFEALAVGRAALEVIGYEGGVEVARRSLGVQGQPARLQLVADLLGQPFSGRTLDAVCLHALVVDGAGNVCTSFDGPVQFALIEGGELVGPPTVLAEAGVASAMLRSTGPGTYGVFARAGGLESNRLLLVARDH
jgi:hypothetical protein